MIAIIDYQMGNLRSVQKAFEKVGFEAQITDDPKKILEAEAIVLPGVGAFGAAMKRLEEAELVEPIRKSINSGKPYLGICLGLQMLFTESEEGGWYQGLDLIPGKVKRFAEGLKIPHIGWNQIKIKKEVPILKGIEDESYVYFVHSYYVIPEDKSIIATTTNYGADFVSMIFFDNVYATQFHPEKSQKIGLKILENFGKLI